MSGDGMNSASVKGIFKTLTAKPWLTGEDATGQPAAPGFALPRQKVGLWVFFFVTTSLFLLFIVSYRMRMYFGESGVGKTAEDWVPLREPMLLWINTAVLTLASVFMQRAKVLAARAAGDAGIRRWFLPGGFAALAFVVLQLAAWRQLAAAGHFVASNPASSFYYLITAVHGLHIIGGLVAWARALARSGERFRLGAELCAVYWHYLLLVWGALFYLLLTT